LAAALADNKGPERLELRFVVTWRLRARLAEARRLYLAAGGELGDAIDSGELLLEVGTQRSLSETLRLDELAREQRSTPAHVIIVFDEAGLELQRRSLDRELPMSPFTVIRELRRTGPQSAPRLTLEPTFSEPLFAG